KSNCVASQRAARIGSPTPAIRGRVDFALLRYSHGTPAALRVTRRRVGGSADASGALRVGAGDCPPSRRSTRVSIHPRDTGAREQPTLGAAWAGPTFFPLRAFGSR